MPIIPIRLATVKATGKRFIVKSIENGKVHTRGSVRGAEVSGLSAIYGRDRVFLESAVEIKEIDQTEELMLSLLEESDTPWF